MAGLFDAKDVKSWSNCSEIKIGEQGYFGYDLQDLERDIKTKKPRKISEINKDSGNPFRADAKCWSWYAFFLPVDKVRNSTYRPLKTFDELFSFLMPNNDEKDTDRKAELLLGKVYRLKEKITGDVCYRYIHSINLSVNCKYAILINGLDLDYLFDKYEIKKNGKWVPFGVIE